MVELALASAPRIPARPQVVQEVDEMALTWTPGEYLVLRPRPGYMPKVPTTPFRDLQALPSEEADPALVLLCPRLQPLAWHLSVTRSLVNICMPRVCDGVQLVALFMLSRHNA